MDVGRAPWVTLSAKTRPLHLIRGLFGSDGYHVQLTDLRSIWEQRVDAAGVHDLGRKQYCLIDLSPKGGQLNAFMGILRANLLESGSRRVLLPVESGVNIVLENKLAPDLRFCWEFNLSKCEDEDAILSNLISPLAGQICFYNLALDRLSRACAEQSAQVQQLLEQTGGASRSDARVFDTAAWRQKFRDSKDITAPKSRQEIINMLSGLAGDTAFVMDWEANTKRITALPEQRQVQGDTDSDEGEFQESSEIKNGKNDEAVAKSEVTPVPQGTPIPVKGAVDNIQDKTPQEEYASQNQPEQSQSQSRKRQASVKAKIGGDKEVRSSPKSTSGIKATIGGGSESNGPRGEQTQKNKVCEVARLTEDMTPEERASLRRQELQVQLEKQANAPKRHRRF